jgi:hypothetical protein
MIHSNSRTASEKLIPNICQYNCSVFNFQTKLLDRYIDTAEDEG